MRKNYILDTSTIVHDCNCFKVFTDNNVIIPIVVLEELDHIKVRPDAAGSMARISIRNLDRYLSQGNISEGVDIENNIKLSIDVENVHDPRFNMGNKDDCILACAAVYENGILVSKDINMRLRAKAHGIEAQDYNNDKLVGINEIYTGYREVELDDSHIYPFTDQGLASVEGTIFEDMYPNECVEVASNGIKTIYRRKGDFLKRIILPKDGVWGIKTKNREQAFAIDLLLDQDINLVTLIGNAGSGKTLLATAAALELVLESGAKYKKADFFKPFTPVGESVGYLPGSLDEKLAPWMGSIKDAIEFLCAGEDLNSFMHMYKEKIKMEALTFVRGRSLNKNLVILDEAQNMTKHEIKTLITRIGYDSKIVITGDISQIDSMYLDASNNGLTYIVEKFKSSKLSGHITLRKGERSPLATEASDIL